MYSKTCRAKVLLSGGLISIFREVRHCIELGMTRGKVPLLCCQFPFAFKSQRPVQTFPTLSIVSVHFPGDQEINFSPKINNRHLCISEN